MRYSFVIWDFNGTIADDLALCMRAINTVLSRRGLPLVASPEQYREQFGFPIREYYGRLGFDFTKEPYEVPADEWVALYTAGLSEVTAMAGAAQVLHRIREAGIPQIILSASERNMLLSQLADLGFSSYFDEVLGVNNVYGGGKLDMAHAFAAAHPELRLSDALFIGDTDHDAATAKALGCDCVLFSGGHMSRQKLENCGCPVVDVLRDVLSIIFS